jgi:hypothetical protein
MGSRRDLAAAIVGALLASVVVLSVSASGPTMVGGWSLGPAFYEAPGGMCDGRAFAERYFHRPGMIQLYSEGSYRTSNGVEQRFVRTDSIIIAVLKPWRGDLRVIGIHCGVGGMGKGEPTTQFAIDGSVSQLK